MREIPPKGPPEVHLSVGLHVYSGCMIPKLWCNMHPTTRHQNAGVRQHRCVFTVPKKSCTTPMSWSGLVYSSDWHLLCSVFFSLDTDTNLGTCGTCRLGPLRYDWLSTTVRSMGASTAAFSINSCSSCAVHCSATQRIGMTSIACKWCKNCLNTSKRVRLLLSVIYMLYSSSWKDLGHCFPIISMQQVSCTRGKLENVFYKKRFSSLIST